MAELNNMVASAGDAATGVAGASNSSSFGITGKNTPNPAAAMLYFFIITAIYCIISILITTGNTVQKAIMKGGYILCVIIGEFFINLNLTATMCGVYQWQSALFITVIPWLLIFGVLQAFLIIFPGWLSPFSNTFGYLVVKLMGLPQLMKEIAVTDTPNDSTAFQAIRDLIHDPSLLINQFSSEESVDKRDEKDNIIKDAKTGKAVQKREIFESAWKNLQKSGIIKPGGAPESELEKTNIVNQGKFYKYVEMKNTIAETVWSLLTGMLVTSVSYNYIINEGCTKSADEMKVRHAAYEENENKKLQANANFQANQPNYVQLSSTTTAAASTSTPP